MMNRFALIVIFIAVAVGAGCARMPRERTDYVVQPRVAAAEWKLYGVPSENASFMMPKYPVRDRVTGPSDYAIGYRYAAYADEAVYEFRSYVKDRECSLLCFLNLFGERRLGERYNELASFEPAPVEIEDIHSSERTIRKYRWETENEIALRWVFPDLENDRWLELAVSYRPDKEPDIQRFLDSLSFSNRMDAEQVGAGAAQIVGDIDTPSEPGNAVNPASAPMISKTQPRPEHTDSAAEMETEGEILVTAQFLADGTVGDVKVIKGLPNGLDDEAIIAARRMAFLPARNNGSRAIVVRQISYNFLVY